MFKLAPNSLAFAGGQSDELSCQTCQLLLGMPKDYQVMEIIYASQAIFTQHCMFTLGGAHYKNVKLNAIKIKQNKVYEAKINDQLTFFGLEKGFRLYLMACDFKANRVGLARGDFNTYFTAVQAKIRLIKGPEFNYLLDAQAFLAHSFIISSLSDLSGIRLEGEKIQARHYDIISAIVDEGIIQLSAKGPIVLLRQGQVTGGYPRIFSVLKTDLNVLAQYKIGAVVHFELIDLAQAKVLLLQREQQLKKLSDAIN
jgi:allophanate hydrolase subunit 2